MSVDLKTLTPDTTINDSAILFGADSQAAASPSVFPVSVVRQHIAGTANTFTQPQVVSVNSSTTALRVTQTGSGNALVVEDSANPDATPFVVNTNGRVGIGVADPSFPLHALGANPVLCIQHSENGAGGAALLGRKSRGDVGSESATLANDYLSSVLARGYGSTGWGSTNVGLIGFRAAENFTDSQQGTYFVVETAATGGTSRSECMRITSAGQVGIGTTALNSESRLMVAGGAIFGRRDASTGVFGDFDNRGQLILSGETSTTKRLALGVDTSAGTMVGVIQAIEASVNVRSLALNPAGGNVGIGTSSPNAAAALDVSSTTQGVLFPRMTTAQRDAISSPPDGLVLYNTTDSKLQVRAGGSWINMH
jgi:hypothetical protein